MRARDVPAIVIGVAARPRQTVVPFGETAGSRVPPQPAGTDHMCNLYTNLTTHEAMRQLFGVSWEDSLLPDGWQPGGPIHPKSSAVVAFSDNGRVCLDEMQWGFLLPQLSKRTGKPILPKAVTNARDDKVLTSGFWMESMERRRCLVPATAYCEYVGRAPAVGLWFEIADDDGPAEPFGFAGIWKMFRGLIRGEEHSFATFAIATTRPNEFVSRYHGRMPVIVAPENYGDWLHGSVKDAAKLLRPHPGGAMRLLVPGGGFVRSGAGS